MPDNSFKLKISTLENGIPEDEFPNKKEGERCKVDIKSVSITELNNKVESVVLTLLKKEGELFSLSIKLKKDSNITGSTLNASSIYGENKYIYNNTDESITILYNVPQGDVILTHILIIGTAVIKESDKTTFTFTVKQSIFVTNTTTEQLTTEAKPLHELLTIEEFLNLRYIDYFSFDNEKFNELYKKISQGGGGISTKIKNKSK
jgi:hypothetical protein